LSRRQEQQKEEDMRYLTLLAAAGLVGATTVACTDDSYYSGRTQYVYSPGYVAPAPAYVYSSGNAYSWRNDRDQDGVPNWRDRRPDNPYRY
jgi:hypothetical protein